MDFQYAAGVVFKSIVEWKEGKKFGLFEDIVRVSKQVYYDNDELKESSNVKVQREAATPTMSHLKSVVMFAFLLPREG